MAESHPRYDDGGDDGDYYDNDDEDDENIDGMGELSLMKVVGATQGESKGVRGGGGSGRVGGGSGSIEGGSGFAGGGKEPAVKTCGIMTTPTFTKLVRVMVVNVFTTSHPSSGTNYLEVV